jgi:hypothetical protein
MKMRRDLAVVQTQDGFDESCDTSGSFQMAMVGFCGTKPHRIQAFSKNGCQSLDFNRITHWSAGAMRLDQADVFRH